MIGKAAVGAALAVFSMATIAVAQQQLPAMTQQTATIKRTALQKFDVPGTAYECMDLGVTMAPTTWLIVAGVVVVLIGLWIMWRPQRRL